MTEKGEEGEGNNGSLSVESSLWGEWREKKKARDFGQSQQKGLDSADLLW